MRSRALLEAGPLDMTEQEVEEYFPGAFIAAKELIAKEKFTGQTRFQCDDMDCHLVVTLDADKDRYVSFSWRPTRAIWKFSF